MPRRANLFMQAEPFQSASGYINALLAEELERLGYGLDPHYRAPLGARDALIPLASADRLRRLSAEPPVDLALYCDRGLGIRVPSREMARHTLVLFHGLMGWPAVWMENPAIDRHCVLSPYMRDVLTSLLARPDWKRRTVNPRAFHSVSYWVPALSCVEAPEGHSLLAGAQLPDTLQRILDSDDVIGHALQAWKPDWTAVYSILLNLNALAREHGRSQRFRLAITEEEYASIARAFAQGLPVTEAPRAGLEALGMTLEDLLIPVEQLSQPALFSLFRRARFGLAYNVFPEPMGFYVLESVFNGCPVYTNGIGNNRHGLPPGHGLHVRENTDMAWGDPSAYAEVAARIYQDWESPGSVEAECLRGREYIQRTYNREAFRRGLHATLESLEREPPAPIPFEQLDIALSPLVRGMDEEGRVISDFENLQLEPAELQLVREAVGGKAGDVLARGLTESGWDRLQGLFSRGVLTLRAGT